MHVERLEVPSRLDVREVTEGNPSPNGSYGALRYAVSAWRAPDLTDSNIVKAGSTWELTATPENGGSRVEIDG